MDHQSSSPLIAVNEQRIQDWQARVISSLAGQLDFSDPVPHVKASTVEAAADILIYLVHWLITHRSLPVSRVTEATFASDFASTFPHQDAECNLTMLSRLIRHGDRLDLRM